MMCEEPAINWRSSLMARRTQVVLTDDLDGTNIPAGKGETVTFGLDGKIYQIDLTSRNGDALRKLLRPYIEAARPVRTSSGARVKQIHIGADAKTIKEWARANGYEVNDRGRISNEIRAAFEAAD
jgi:nucleoid-associated protein Lsr2